MTDPKQPSHKMWFNAPRSGASGDWIQFSYVGASPPVQPHAAQCQMAIDLYNQGVDLHAKGVRLQDAIDKFDQSVVILSSLVESLGEQCPANYRFWLASVYLARGLVKRRASDHGPLASVIDCEQAVAVAETLRQVTLRHGKASWLPQYRSTLAKAYTACGIAKSMAEGHGRLAAIDEYNRAISTMEELRDALMLQDKAAWTLTHRRDLANAIMNRGVAKLSTDLHGPLAAIADFRRAIAEMEGIRELLLGQRQGGWGPGPRSDLANAYANSGTAKMRANGYGPVAAIVDYNAAIRIMETMRDALLPLGETSWTPIYRSGLATAYVNRGKAKRTAYGHGPLAAIEDCNRAIGVMEALGGALRLKDMEALPPQYRHILATAIHERAIARHDTEGHASLAVLEDCGRTVALCKSLLEPMTWFLALDLHSKASGLATAVLLEIDEPSRAIAAGLCGLALGRKYEHFERSSVRTHREYLFALTIEAYGAAKQWDAMCALIMAELDPEALNTACDSEQMVTIAVAAIERALHTVGTDTATADERQGASLREAAAFLDRLRWRYFAGTAGSAEMRARLMEARGDAVAAEAILSGYLDAHRLDPEGLCARAAFYGRQGEPEAAIDDYVAFAQGVIHWNSLEPEAAVDDLLAVAKQALLLHVSGLVARGTTLDVEEGPLHNWLLDRDRPETFFARILAGLGERDNRAWRKTLKPALERLWDMEIKGKAHAEIFRRGLREGLRQGEAALRAIAAKLPVEWGDFVLSIAAAWSDVAALPERDDDALSDLIVEAVVARVRQAARRIEAAALVPAEQQIAELLGPIWHDRLSPDERRYLACALRSLSDPAMRQFAPLPLGCAVETALWTRLYDGMRQAHQRENRPIPPPEDKKTIWQKLHARLTQNPNIPVELGPLAGALSSALCKLDPPPAEARHLTEAIAAFLARQAEIAILTDADAALRARRREILDRFPKLRNDAAHPRETPPNLDECMAAWRDIVANPDDAFFRWFPVVVPQGGPS